MFMLHVFLSLIASSSLAQRPVTSVSEAQIVVRAARMIDVKGGRVIDKPEIVVRGKTIESVGTSTKAPPAGAELVDLGDVTLVPGLMDMHTHLAYTLEG